MAQWMGQYSGHTHKTRVEDMEAALHRTVAALRLATSEQDRRKKAKAVLHVAKRLTSARMKLGKTHHAALQSLNAMEPHEPKAESLSKLKARIRPHVLASILIEFGVEEDVRGL